MDPDETQARASFPRRELTPIPPRLHRAAPVATSRAWPLVQAVLIVLASLGLAATANAGYWTLKAWRLGVPFLGFDPAGLPPWPQQGVTWLLGVAWPVLGLSFLPKRSARVVAALLAISAAGVAVSALLTGRAYLLELSMLSGAALAAGWLAARGVRLVGRWRVVPFLLSATLLGPWLSTWHPEHVILRPFRAQIIAARPASPEEAAITAPEHITSNGDSFVLEPSDLMSLEAGDLRRAFYDGSSCIITIAPSRAAELARRSYRRGEQFDAFLIDGSVETVAIYKSVLLTDEFAISGPNASEVCRHLISGR